MADTASTPVVSDVAMAETSDDERPVSEQNNSPEIEVETQSGDGKENTVSEESDDPQDEGGEEASGNESSDDESQSSASEDEGDENTPSDGLSSYERQRLLRIQRNQERLESLGLLENKPQPVKKKGPRKSTGKPKQDFGPARVLPKREVKTRLSMEQINGGLDIRRMRLSGGGMRSFNSRKSKTRCGECKGCTREDDCNTCVYCVERMNGKDKPRRCLFKTCLHKYKKDEKPQKSTDTAEATSGDNNDDNKAESSEEHSDVCDICQDGGDLILCGGLGCHRAFHSNCHFPKIKKLPDDDWLCMECNPRKGFLFAVLPEEKKLTRVKIIEPAPKCKVCDEDCPDIATSSEEENIQCKACDAHFHIHCHDPPMESKPRGGAARWWKCHGCKEANKPILEHHMGSYERVPKTPKTPKTPRVYKPKNIKLFEGEHDDDCYICDNGGELVCCDFCPKVFHAACHIPALPALPTGIWKCCECYAGERKRKTRCGDCKACRSEDCGKCQFCLDKPKFGGNNTLKKPCVKRECPYQSFAEMYVPGKIPGEITYGACRAASSTKPPNPKASSTKTPNPKRKKEKKRKRDSDVNKGSTGNKSKRVKIEDTDAAKPSPAATPPTTTALTAEGEGKAVVSPLEEKGKQENGSLERDEQMEEAGDVKIEDSGKRDEPMAEAGTVVANDGNVSVERDVQMAEAGDTVAEPEETQSPTKVPNSEESNVVKIKIPKLMDTVSVKIRKLINGAYKEPEDSKVQDKACEHLRKFINKVDLNKIILAGGIEMISSAMARHPDKTICQAEAACTIAEIAWIEPAIGAKLAHMGVLVQIVKCMERFPNNLKCQQMGVGAFRSLSYSDSNIQFIHDANGLPAVLNSMVTNPRKLVVQKEGCYFLQNMLTACDVANEVVEAGIVPIILEALSNESADSEFKESVLGLVSNLAVNKSAKAIMGKSGAISTLISAVRSSPEVEVRHASCTALKHIATDSNENKTIIWEADGLSAILSSITSFADNPVMSIAAFDLLKELALEDEGIAADIVKQGGLKTVLLAMKKHADLAMVQIAACGVIAYLAYENEDKVAPKVAEAIVAALENHPKASEVQISGCEALLEIVTHVSAVCKLVKRKKTQQLLLAAKEGNKDCESDVDDLLAS